jgi:predicted nucleic acid-binding protein
MLALLDADAFICLRKWSLLEVFQRVPGLSFVMTEYVARHELSSLQQSLSTLEESGKLRIEAVAIRTPAFKRYKALLVAGADRGEAESIAWACTVAQEERPVFVSLDALARRHARGAGLPVQDVMGLAVVVVEAGLVALEAVQPRLEVWEDSKQAFGRPRDFTTFEETWHRRVATLRSTVN